jgi:hypothetical protein
MDFRTAVKMLILHLPERLQVYWLDLDLLHDAVEVGGFPGILKEDIKSPLKSPGQSHPFVRKDHWYGHRQLFIAVLVGADTLRYFCAY